MSSADLFSLLLVGLTQDVAGVCKLCLSGVCADHSCTVVSLVLALPGVPCSGSSASQ